MQNFWELAGYFLYMGVATTFIPLPTDIVPIYLGQIYSPIHIALLGALGAACSSFCEYHLMVYFFGRGKFQWLERSEKVWKIKSKLKGHLPLGLLVSSATGLIPADAVRLLGMITRFSPYKTFALILPGRFFRYWVLAELGEHLEIAPRYLLAFFALLFVWAIYRIHRSHHLIQV